MKELYNNESIDFRESLNDNSLNKSDEFITEKYVKGEVRIITEQARYPLNTILSMVESDDYILNPEFQRRHRWNATKKSRLIESFIMNVPIPPVFLYEVKYSVYEVMDGLQRMTAISQFYKDRFALQDLDEWPELNGKKYSELPEQIRRGIDRRYLSSIILLQETAKSDIEAKRLKQLVFERINSGGEKLTPQETRNALYPGGLNNLCISLARTNSFCRMWNIPEPTLEEISDGTPSQELIENHLYSKMQDVELVLRFFAYRQIEKWENPSLEVFLDEFIRKGNLFENTILDHYESQFKDTCDLLFSLYGEQAFWLQRQRQGNWILYERPTKVLYDPLMYVLSDFIGSADLLISKKTEIRDATKQLHQEHQDILGGRNTNRNDVLQRIDILKPFYQQFL